MDNSIQAAKAKRYSEALFPVVDQIISTHLHVLVEKRRKTISIDDYGQECRDNKAWGADLTYFVHRVVLPEIESKGMAGYLETMESHLLMNEADRPDVVEFLREHRSISGFHRGAIIGKVLDRVDAILNLASVGPDVSSMSSADFFDYCAGELRETGWSVRPVPADRLDQAILLAERSSLLCAILVNSGRADSSWVEIVHHARTQYRAQIAMLVNGSAFPAQVRSVALQFGIILNHHLALRTLSL